MSLQDLKTAIRLHRNGRLKAAHEVYTRLAADQPSDVKLISLLGQLELQMGESDAAIEHLRQAAALAPNDRRVTLTLTRGLAATGHHSEAIGIVHRMLAQDDSYADAWTALAAVHRYQGDHVNELVALERATELVPDEIPALIARANAEVANGYVEKAIETLKAAARLSPRNPRVVNNLGALYLRRNNLAAAEAVFRQVLQFAPDYAVALVNLAVTLHRLGRLDDAREAAERALKVAPGKVRARTELASILMSQGDLAGAEAGFKVALDMAPTDHAVLAGLAELREKQGRPLEGLQLVTGVVKANPVGPGIRLVGAGLAHRLGRREVALDLLAPLLDDRGDPKANLDRATHRRLCFLLGDINDASSDYGAALRHYTAANSMLRPEYDSRLLYERVDRIIDCFDSAESVKRKDAVKRLPRRLFLVGLPRSGTGLLHKMLQRHPEIQACGPLSLLGQLVNEKEFFPAGFQGLSDNDLNRLGDRYCAGAAAPPEVRFMTDSMPLNFFYLGAIAQMLPDSLVVHCRRYPADVLLSCYFQNYQDPALAFSSGLDDLQHYWRNYSRLMHHWQEIVGDMIFEMDYEELVGDPEGAMRPLIERLDLAWDWEVLNPEADRRHVSVATQAPLSDPIHSRSVGRFARYRPFWGDRPDLAALSYRPDA